MSQDELLIRQYAPSDRDAVIALWEQCGLLRRWNDPRKDIARKLTVQPEMFLVGELEGRVVAVVMAGYEGHRGWVNYLAVASEHRRRGHGRAMMAEVERLLARVGCPKVNLQIRSENHDVGAFYESLGYARDDVVCYGKRLEPDG